MLYAIGAYGLWGIFPIYFKAVKDVAPLEVLAHRILWSAVLLVLLMLLRRDLGSVMQALRRRRTLAVLATTTALIAGNWLVFIWAVGHDRLMQASLGYFINPLLSVLLGFLFLRERLRRWQTVSVLIAAAGVAYLTISLGELPGVALFLASSFAFYGLLRKVAPVEAMAGLTAETSLLAPAAAAFLAYQIWHRQAAFGGGSLRLDGLLLSAGVITATPLLWFTEAARRLRLTTIGFMQFIAPTGHFLLALAYGEPLTRSYGVAFAFIWTALAIYSVDAASSQRPAPPSCVAE